MAEPLDDASKHVMGSDDWTATLSEADLATFKCDQLSPREQAHAREAIAIAQQCGIFCAKGATQSTESHCYRLAIGNEHLQLEQWKMAMRAMVESAGNSECPNSQMADEAMDQGDVIGNDAITDDETGSAYMLAQLATEEHTLEPSNVEDLLVDQRRAYDIIEWHLQQFVAGRCPDQLRMIIPGEGGVGKSKTIQTITDNFYRHGIGGMLVKAAYTGIAASVIDGKTLHNIAVLPFGGLNVILVSDFHQFPPVATKASVPLFWPCNVEKDTEDELLGRRIYEQFDIVVQLKTQVRVTDPEWHDLLQHVHNGSCSEHLINMLRGLVLDNATCPPTNFHSSPWNDAVLVTPRHAVRMQWNSMTAYERANTENITLISCPALDTVGGRALTLPEKFAVAANPKSGRGCNRQERGGLSDDVVLAIGMCVMVTFNITTDLDIANGARGRVVNIVLDSRESLKRSMNNVIQLEYPPVYVLVEMNRTKANALPGLPTGVLLVTPICRTFTVSSAGGKRTTISRVHRPFSHL
ncbi:hypothetical protein M404DRAFT_20672 [Pisolithus tinctorius Marx 270]|uniref:DNA helicase n=1 Tax=Pisolithus tinctorius Marx 270 TaxID=870435 RepID=A0A0C3KNJ5_PISTI|nr:hypothetical protein M404DRAFT_20672 [Pisolithus tinctorius Marx 270]